MLILGQAAQGKTTLAASYVKNATTPSAWINLDQEESDPVNLFQLLVQALQHVSPVANLSPLLDYQSMAIGPRAEMPLYRDWINALFGRVARPIQIVLDGLDRLVDDAPSFRLLQVVLQNTPEDVCIIMLSRDMPPLEIHDLEIKQEAFLLTNEDLAFTTAEVKKFFRKLRNVSLTSQQWLKIHQITEGWIGGLILISEALNRWARVHKGEYTFDADADGFSGEVFRYFRQEILSAQSDRVREFLVKSSVAEAIEPGFMNALLGTANAEDILQDLQRRNLFTQAVHDKKKGWLYRYHQLFREFLNARFEAETGNRERQALLLKAGHLSEQTGRMEDSIKYYLRAKAYPQAVSVIKRIGLHVLRRGRTGDLSQWLESLPEELVQRNPWLLLFLSMTRRFTEVNANVSRLKKALTLFEEHGDVKGQLLALAYLIEALITRGRDPIPLAILLEQGETLLVSLTSDAYPYERAALWFQLGFGQMFRGGNPQKGFWACQNAYLLAKNLGDVPLQFNALVHVVNNLSTLGEFPEADKACNVLERIAAEQANPEMRTLYLLALSQLLTLEGSLEEAAATVCQAGAEIERWGLLYLYPFMLVYDLVAKAQLGRFAEAEDAGNRLINFSSSMDSLFLYGDAALFLGLTYYQKEDFQNAKEMLETARQVLSSDEARANWQLSLCHILISLVSYHLQESRGIDKKLQEVLDYHKSMSSNLIVIESHFVIALLKWKENKASEAIPHLAAGFKIAKERGYEHFVLVSRKDFARVCALAIELDVAEATDYAAHLLSNRLASQAARELERLSHCRNESIRKKAREIQVAIHRNKLPRLRIETLGRFRVFRDDSLVEDREWKGSQPKLLLKAIIARGSHWLSYELLMEDLWPQGAPSTVKRNFRVTLHRLRKALEPGMDQNFGSSYVHFKGGFICLDDELCHVDVADFLSLDQRGKFEEQQGDARKALSLYERAIEQYKGDFLEEELYAPWAEEKRRDLRARYIALLRRTAELYETRGASRKAIAAHKRLIRADPLLEEAYQRLMVLYLGLGKRSAAIKTYEECKETLRVELATEPDKVTTAIYKKCLQTS